MALRNNITNYSKKSWKWNVVYLFFSKKGIKGKDCSRKANIMKKSDKIIIYKNIIIIKIIIIKYYLKNFCLKKMIL